MVCKECEKRGKNWEGDDPQCAFKGKEFGYNWNCATVGLIRDICDELGQERPQGVDYQYCEDQKYATVKVDHIESLEGRPLALWVSWYKRRDRCDVAAVRAYPSATANRTGVLVYRAGIWF